MILAKPWDGKDLKGYWQITYKIDGIRAIYSDDRWLSRSGKPLYNMPQPTSSKMVDVEVYCHHPDRSSQENYKVTSEKIKAKNQNRPIAPEDLYSLDPIDPRLNSGWIADPSAEQINIMLEEAISDGYEGLVLRQGNTWLKVKPVETHDVKITGAVEGTGRNKGRLGALITERGRVGNGFSDTEREHLWLWYQTGHSGIVEQPLEGCFVEVDCMELTLKGKFRHPRFIRIRWDK